MSVSLPLLAQTRQRVLQKSVKRYFQNLRTFAARDSFLVCVLANASLGSSCCFVS